MMKKMATILNTMTPQPYCAIPVNPQARPRAEKSACHIQTMPHAMVGQQKAAVSLMLQTPAAAATRVLSLPAAAFNSAPQISIGREAHTGSWQNTNPNELQREGYQMVSPHWLDVASQTVPSQHDQVSSLRDWCCGPNSATRAGRMMGDMILNFHALAAGCPLGACISVPFKTWRIGPRPQELQPYLRSVSFALTNAQAQCTDRWLDICDTIRRSCEAGKPVMVLLVWGQFSMHYVNVVALHGGQDRVAIMDTNGRLYSMALEELHTEMLQDVPFSVGLARYNAVHFI